MNNVFDGFMDDAAAIGMYRGWVAGEEDAPKARLENWLEEDLVAYVGGEFAKRKE